jgi:hypothetical protein
MVDPSRLVIYCLLRPAGADALDDVRAHYRSADPRVRVLIDRRTGQRRRGEGDPPRTRPERRGGTDRRRFIVPRRLAPHRSAGCSGCSRSARRPRRSTTST